MRRLIAMSIIQRGLSVAAYVVATMIIARLLTPAERTMLFEPAKSTTGATLPYAIGWFSQTIRGVQVQWSYGYWVANSALIIRVPSMHRAFVALANSDGLSAPFPLGSGNLESSPVAKEFLEAFVFGSAALR